MNDEAGPTTRLVLASSSPRRREIIAALDMQVQVSSSEVDEGPARRGESPEEYVVRLSREKALAAARSEGSWLSGTSHNDGSMPFFTFPFSSS